MKTSFFATTLAAALALAFTACSGDSKEKENVTRVSGVTLSKSSLQLDVGGLEKLTASVQPSNATNKNVSWQSSNPGIASVANDGTVRAHKKGTATITALTQDCGYHGHSANHHAGHNSGHQGGSCNGGHQRLCIVTVLDNQASITVLEGTLAKNILGEHFVGDVLLDLTGSSLALTIDGKPNGIGELQPGMTVEISGSMANVGHCGGHQCHCGGQHRGCNHGNHHGGHMQCGGHFACSHITSNKALSGNIEAINNQTFIITGITVVVDADTFFAKRNASGTYAEIGFASLKVGDTVHIWGILQENGTILATRICQLP